MTKNEQKVRKYINSVRASIKAVYSGKVPGQFEAQLQQLADFYAAYLKASDAFQNQEIVTLINDGKTSCTNANLTAMLSISNHMDKIVKNFGLSPLALKRIMGSIVQEEEDGDFMNEL